MSDSLPTELIEIIGICRWFTGGQFPFNEGAQIQLIINKELYSSFEGSSYIARAIREDFTQRQ